MPEGTCSIPECDGPCVARGWCQKHYVRWHRHGDPLHGKPVALRPCKPCQHCGSAITKSSRWSAAQWERKRYCSKSCHSSAINGPRKKHDGLTKQQRHRHKHTDWAAWWEWYRQREDRAELRTWKPKVWPHCRLGRRAEPRLFIGRHCQADGCDATWVSYAAMPDAIYCKRCNRARWRETHYERAARHGAQFDVIDPLRIFQRDNWRCQLCGRKTDKTGWPNPKRATLDHIVPLARGGHHVAQNLQCACWLCNARKGARSADDQLRLAV